MEKYPADKAIEEVKEGRGVVLNVCMPYEYAGEHVPGSVNIPIDDIAAGKEPDVKKDTQIFIHCASGGRAEKAKGILKEKGFKNVHNIGGLVDWEKAGGPVERKRAK